MPDLTEDRIKTYMADRKAEGASNRTINMELDVLSRAVGSKFKILWPKLKRLEENHDVGIALTPEQEAAVLAAAAESRSPLLYPWVQTLGWTGMRKGVEALKLQWQQINFDGAREITVGDSKTDAGKGRRIPMTANLKAVLTQHRAWYESKLGSVQPQWYVFPSRKRSVPSIRPNQLYRSCPPGIPR